jgi:hypothetical protein
MYILNNVTSCILLNATNYYTDRKIIYLHFTWSEKDLISCVYRVLNSDVLLNRLRYKKKYMKGWLFERPSMLGEVVLLGILQVSYKFDVTVHN